MSEKFALNYSNVFMRHMKCFPDQQDRQGPWRASVKYRTVKSLKRAKSCSSFFSHGSTKMAKVVTIIGTQEITYNKGVALTT